MKPYSQQQEDLPSVEISKTLLTFPDNNALVLSIRAKALIFSDVKSKELLDRAERIASSDVTALIIGETGTGKELLARHIHNRSRRKGAFIAINCGAFSESLIEAELFGHESGAFTGASQARAGWFETANGGTLFLDEIGDLPFSMQVKLLRVLQERQVTRIGSRRSIPIDVRLIAATNIDLIKAVMAGHFRMDLYYRLNVAMLHLPPLRERTGDIMPLVEHFIEVYRDKLHLSHITISPKAKMALLEYAWPGNIRELENVIHYALIVCVDNIVDVEYLRFSPLVSHLSLSKNYMEAGTQVSHESDLNVLKKGFITLFEKDVTNIYSMVEEALVRSAFKYCEENQVRTARLLNISRNVLRAQLKRFGMLNDKAAIKQLLNVTNDLPNEI